MTTNSWSSFWISVNQFFTAIKVHCFRGAGERSPWIVSVANCITNNPVILLFFLICLVGIGVGIFRRLTRLH